MKNEASNYKLDHKLRVKSDDLIGQMHEYDIDLKSNHIYLMGIETYSYGTGSEGGDEPGIEYVIANRFIRNFNLCMRVNPERPIVIHMKTNGGLWEEAMAIYDTIRSCPWFVTILNYTHARSMSSIILQAANKRVMMPNSYFMFHEGTLGIDGTQKQIYSAIAFNKNADKTMLDIYANMMNTTKGSEYYGVGVTKIKNWLKSQMDRKEDVYLTAKDTVKLGLADEIFDYDWSKLTDYTQEQQDR